MCNNLVATGVTHIRSYIMYCMYVLCMYIVDPNRSLQALMVSTGVWTTPGRCLTETYPVMIPSIATCTCTCIL